MVVSSSTVVVIGVMGVIINYWFVIMVSWKEMR